MSGDLLDETNSRVVYSLSAAGDLYQRRSLHSPETGWSDCPRKEATNYFEKQVGFEYRALSVLPLVGDLQATSVVTKPKPSDALADDCDGKIVAWADRFMRRSYDRDEAHGYFYPRAIADALNIIKTDARKRLDALAESGHLRTTDFANGRAWRSINLLPFEATQ